MLRVTSTNSLPLYGGRSGKPTPQSVDSDISSLDLAVPAAMESGDSGGLSERPIAVIRSRVPERD